MTPHHNPALRLVALLVVSCLLTDPAQAAAAGWSPRPAPRSSSVFESQALGVRSTAVQSPAPLSPIMERVEQIEGAAHFLVPGMVVYSAAADNLEAQVARIGHADISDIRKEIIRILGSEVPRSREERGFIFDIVDILWSNLDEALTRHPPMRGFWEFRRILTGLSESGLRPLLADFVRRHFLILDMSVLLDLLNEKIVVNPLWREPTAREMKFLGRAYQAMITGVARGAHEAIFGDADVPGFGLAEWDQHDAEIQIAMELGGYLAHENWNLAALRRKKWTGGVAAALFGRIHDDRLWDGVSRSRKPTFAIRSEKGPRRWTSGLFAAVLGIGGFILWTHCSPPQRLLVFSIIGAAAPIAATLWSPRRPFTRRARLLRVQGSEILERSYTAVELTRLLDFSARNRLGRPVWFNPADSRHLDQWKTYLTLLNGRPDLEAVFLYDDPNDVRLVWKPAWAASHLPHSGFYATRGLRRELQLQADDDLDLVVKELNEDLAVPFVIQLRTPTPGMVFVHPVDPQRLEGLTPGAMSAQLLAEGIGAPLELLDSLIPKLNNSLSFPFWIARQNRKGDQLLIRALDAGRMRAAAEKLYKKDLQTPIARLDKLVRTLRLNGYNNDLLIQLVNLGSQIGRNWTYAHDFSTHRGKETAFALSGMKNMVNHRLSSALGEAALAAQIGKGGPFFEGLLARITNDIQAIRQFRRHMRRQLYVWASLSCLGVLILAGAAALSAAPAPLRPPSRVFRIAA